MNLRIAYVVSALLLPMTGCLNIKLTCQCTDGNPASVVGEKCGSTNDGIALAGQAYLEAGTNCLIAGGTLGECAVELTPLTTCPLETINTKTDAPVADASFAQ